MPTVMKSAFKENKKKWGRFHAWELHQKTRASVGTTFRLIGSWVDFFLSKHPHPFPKFPNVHGIQKMHRSLSCLSKTE